MTTISTTPNKGTLTITSNDGPVLVIEATNRENKQPALRIKQAGEHGGAASIRIDDPNPDIEFVETGLPSSDPNAGKFEIAVQADQLQINGRKADVGPKKGFETIVVFTRPAAGGNIGFGFPDAHYKKFGGGRGVIVIANASVAPTRDIAGAGDFVCRGWGAQVSGFEWNGHSHRASLGSAPHAEGTQTYSETPKENKQEVEMASNYIWPLSKSTTRCFWLPKCRMIRDNSRHAALSMLSRKSEKRLRDAVR